MLRTSKTLSKFIFFIIILLSIVGSSVNAYAISSQPYSRDDWEKIIIIITVAVLIFIPSKFRVIVIGTVLGLTLAYLTYKYFLPILL